VWKRFCICEKIDYHHESVLNLRNICRGSLTQWSVSWSRSVVPKYGSKLNKGGEGSQMGSRCDPKRGCVFSKLPGLTVFVCSIGTWEKNRLLTLKTNFATSCQKSLLFSHVVWGLGREVFTKLRFGSRSKKFGNRWSSHSSVSGWSLFQIH